MAKGTVLCPSNKIRTLVATAGSATEVDDLVVVNGLLTVAYADIASGEEGSFIFQADDVAVPKGAGAISAGAVVYWDTANNVVTTTAGSLKKVGIVVAAAASADTTVRIFLDSLMGA